MKEISIPTRCQKHSQLTHLSTYFFNNPSPSWSPTGTDPYEVLPQSYPSDCPCWIPMALWIKFEIKLSPSKSSGFSLPFLWLELLLLLLLFTIAVLLLLMLLFIGWLLELSALSESESLSSSLESLDEDELSSPICEKHNRYHYTERRDKTYVIESILRLLLVLLLLQYCTRCFWHRCWGR